MQSKLYVDIDGTSYNKIIDYTPGRAFATTFYAQACKILFDTIESKNISFDGGQTHEINGFTVRGINTKVNFENSMDFLKSIDIVQEYRDAEMLLNRMFNTNEFDMQEDADEILITGCSSDTE